MAQKLTDIYGKGNVGMYIDRSPAIYAAGVRSLQPGLRIEDCFNNNIDLVAVDNISNKTLNLPKLKATKVTEIKDMRNAGPYTEGSSLINPPVMTKFQTLVEDLKCTVYKSYWNKQVGKARDASSLPQNINNNVTFGKETERFDNLYDVILPIISNENNSSEPPGHQMDRNYCKPHYSFDTVFGNKSNTDRSGNHVKRCLTNDKIIIGTSSRQPVHIKQVKFQQKNQAELGVCLMPNENINCVPEGHVFGKVKEKDNIIGCFTKREMGPERENLKNYLAHLNTLRKCLSKRFDNSFFRKFFLELKFLDSTKKGWLPKKLVYQLCLTKYIRFNSSMIEPLLSMWNALNGMYVKYETFINIINYREPLPLLPKVSDIPIECTDFTTTYKEMVKPQQSINVSMAGVPSGRYFDKDFPITPDGYCKADRTYLPQESDVRACLCPSILTLFGINHRDMYAVRNPEEIKRVFQGTGEIMREDMFNIIWNDAKKYHRSGLVCYETFRQALREYRVTIKNNIK